MRIIFGLACLACASQAWQVEASSDAFSTRPHVDIQRSRRKLASILFAFNLPTEPLRHVGAVTLQHGDLKNIREHKNSHINPTQNFYLPSARAGAYQHTVDLSGHLALHGQDLTILRTTQPKMTSSAQASKLESSLMRGCGVGWLALTIPSLIAPNLFITDVFGLDQSTFEARIREPAAGFLEITSTFFPFEAILLFALASGSEAFDLEDRSRMGAGIAFSCIGILTTLALAAAGGLTMENPFAIIAFVGLNLATALVASRASFKIAEPLQLYQSDFANLFSGGDGSGSNKFASIFYRSSILIGLVVGASFVASPVSPITINDKELPVTHMLRQDFGVYFCFLLCTVQAILYRAAQDGDLGQAFIRALNVVTGLECCFIAFDGEAILQRGAASFAALDPSDPLLNELAAAGLGSGASRQEVNTAAAASLAISVGVVYFLQALASKPAEDD